MQYLQTVVPDVVPYSMQDSRSFLTGHMDQKTYGLTLNLQVNVTPDISLQFYGSPFTSTAKFNNFKVMENTISRTYEERYRTLSAAEVSALNINSDFSFNEFRSNLVARWEYMPGSTLYFVWEHRMSNRDTRYLSGWGSNLDRMFGLPSTNTFMLKVNYWFDI